jgi:hypothetical protein
MREWESLEGSQVCLFPDHYSSFPSEWHSTQTSQVVSRLGHVGEVNRKGDACRTYSPQGFSSRVDTLRPLYIPMQTQTCS